MCGCEDGHAHQAWEPNQNFNQNKLLPYCNAYAFKELVWLWFPRSSKSHTSSIIWIKKKTQCQEASIQSSTGKPAYQTRIWHCCWATDSNSQPEWYPPCTTTACVGTCALYSHCWAAATEVNSARNTHGNHAYEEQKKTQFTCAQRHASITRLHANSSLTSSLYNKHPTYGWLLNPVFAERQLKHRPTTMQHNAAIASTQTMAGKTHWAAITSVRAISTCAQLAVHPWQGTWTQQPPYCKTALL